MSGSGGGVAAGLAAGRAASANAVSANDWVYLAALLGAKYTRSCSCPLARRARAPAAIAAAIGCSEAFSTAAASRSSSVTSVPGAAATSVSVMRPVVIVPVLSSTTVSTRRVLSSTSGPLITMPSCAPRPVPTRIAVGVARPIAHGQAMISTATAAVNALAAGQRRHGDHQHNRDENRGNPIGQALHGRLARLRLGDQAGKA